jgi:NADH-quinone oxidoreductase subunit J
MPNEVTAAFVIIGILILVSGVAAMTLRNLVHCVLALAITFAGLAALYLQLGAQFVGFAQLLVYVGAVAILIVFAILLTRGAGPVEQPIYASHWLVGVGIAVLVFGVMAGLLLSSKVLVRPLISPPEASVRQLGDELMTKYVMPLEVLGLLLTAALIGAVILAMREGGAQPTGDSP